VAAQNVRPAAEFDHMEWRSRVLGTQEGAERVA
jgi:hypothetical protein